MYSYHCPKCNTLLLEKDDICKCCGFSTINLKKNAHVFFDTLCSQDYIIKEYECDDFLKEYNNPIVDCNEGRFRIIINESGILSNGDFFDICFHIINSKASKLG